MSIVYTADVFCDGDDCSQWTNGVSSAWPPTHKQARTEHAPHEGWLFHKGRDYCPACKRKIFAELRA